ncbi:hypothetical protein FS749_006776 [Ceratobasidium sp. UAMH 11750]|nr:hypothetical protein FS749_006776 [Ceratobasidium sp. UAMH 11750]
MASGAPEKQPAAHPSPLLAGPGPFMTGSGYSSKPRSLIVCIDGTSNKYCSHSTNVVELYSHIVKSDAQLTYYTSGVGTHKENTGNPIKYVKRWLDSKFDLAFAWTIEAGIMTAYRWLSDHYQPGDRIFLFGFSRGAYQVRALAGMIATVGLIFPGNHDHIPSAFELYKGYKGDSVDDVDAVVARNQTEMPGGPIGLNKHKVDTFRATFSRHDVKVYFLGVWDTVSSTGFRRKTLMPLTRKCEHIEHFRHALAIDERRVKFQPEYVDKPEGNHDVKEVWFTGTHSDMCVNFKLVSGDYADLSHSGGGNVRNNKLNRGAESLVWMMNEAERLGLRLDPTNLGPDVTHPRVIPSLGITWWILEGLTLTRLSNRSEGMETTMRPHRGHGRVIPGHHGIHCSVFVGGPESDAKSHKSRAWLCIPKKNKNNNYEPRARVNGWSWDKPYSELGPRLEGDKDLIETLKIVRAAEANFSEEAWLNNVQEFLNKESSPKMVWEHGGLPFLLKLARFGNEPRVRGIVRLLLGLHDDEENPSDNPSPKGPLPSPPIGSTPVHGAPSNAQEISEAPETTPTFPPDHKHSVTVEDLVKNSGLKERLNQLRLAKEGIHRLPDLLTCYGKPSPREPIKTTWINRARKLLPIGRKHNKPPKADDSCTATPAVPGQRSSNNQLDGDSDTHQSNGTPKTPGLVLIRLALNAVTDLAELGFSPYMWEAGVTKYIVHILGMEVDSWEALNTETWRALNSAALQAIAALALGDVFTPSRLVGSDEHVISVIVAKLATPSDNNITREGLRALAGLAANPRNSDYFKHAQLNNCWRGLLEKSDNELRAYAVHTIAALVESHRNNPLASSKPEPPTDLENNITSYLIRNELLSSVLSVYDARDGLTISAARKLPTDGIPVKSLIQYDVVCILEGLANDGNTSGDIVSHERSIELLLSKDEMTEAVARKRIQTMVRLAAQLPDNTKPLDFIEKMTSVLEYALSDPNLVCDALEAIVKLAAVEKARTQFLDRSMVKRIVDILSPEMCSKLHATSFGPALCRVVSTMSQTVKAVETLSLHEAFLKSLLSEEVLIKLLRICEAIQGVKNETVQSQPVVLASQAPAIQDEQQKQETDYPSHPLFQEYIELFRTVLRCIETLANHDDEVEKKLAEHVPTMRNINKRIRSQSGCPPDFAVYATRLIRSLIEKMETKKILKNVEDDRREMAATSKFIAEKAKQIEDTRQEMVATTDLFNRLGGILGPGNSTRMLPHSGLPDFTESYCGDFPNSEDLRGLVEIRKYLLQSGIDPQRLFGSLFQELTAFRRPMQFGHDMKDAAECLELNRQIVGKLLPFLCSLELPPAGKRAIERLQRQYAEMSGMPPPRSPDYFRTDACSNLHYCAHCDFQGGDGPGWPWRGARLGGFR